MVSVQTEKFQVFRTILRVSEKMRRLREALVCRVAGEIAAAPKEGSSVPPGSGTARLQLIDALHSIGDAELARVQMKVEPLD